MSNSAATKESGRVTSSQTLREVVKRRLLDRIASIGGDSTAKLGAERVLAKEMETSRGTLREALKELEHQGVIVRRSRHGTYVKVGAATAIRTCVYDMKRPVDAHLIGSIREQIEMSGLGAELDLETNKGALYFRDRERKILDYLRRSEPLSFMCIPQVHLPELAELGLVENLSYEFGNWSQRGNLFDIVEESIKIDGKVVAFPFQCSLSGFVINRRLFDDANVEPEEMFSSLDSFIEGLERLSAGLPEGCFTLVSDSLRALVEFVFRAHRPDLVSYFGAGAGNDDVNIAVLESLAKMFQHQRVLAGGSVSSDENVLNYDDIASVFADSKAAIVLTSLSPRRYFQQALGMRDWSYVDFMIPCFGEGGRPVSVYNSLVWVVNSGAEPTARDFARRFLADYLAPHTVSALDRRYLESNESNERTYVFREGVVRLPRDEWHEQRRNECFEAAVAEMPYPVGKYENFVLTVHRVTASPDSEIRREYEFFGSMNRLGFQLEIPLMEMA